jgi:hypothetical protein
MSPGAWPWLARMMMMTTTTARSVWLRLVPPPPPPRVDLGLLRARSHWWLRHGARAERHAAGDVGHPAGLEAGRRHTTPASEQKKRAHTQAERTDERLDMCCIFRSIFLFKWDHHPPPDAACFSMICMRQ